MSIADMVRANERAWRSDEKVREDILRIWDVMRESIYRGCHTGGTLPGGLGVVRRAAKLPPEQAADELFLGVLSRRPTAEERASVASALGRASATERPATCGELVWALLTSAEFRFNH